MFLVMAVLALGLVPLVAEATVPVIYRCTVYENGVLVGAGIVVEAYCGAPPNFEWTTDAQTNINGVCFIQYSPGMDDFGMPLSFKVDGVWADETPDVDVTLAAPEVRLDITTGVCQWDFAHGLIQDPAAVFPKRYVCPQPKTLAYDDVTLPDCLSIVWFYDEVAMDWFWFRPTWPESTLTSLEYDSYYDVIVTVACTWVLQSP